MTHPFWFLPEATRTIDRSEWSPPVRNLFMKTSCHSAQHINKTLSEIITSFFAQIAYSNVSPNNVFPLIDDLKYFNVAGLFHFFHRYRRHKYDSVLWGDFGVIWWLNRQCYSCIHCYWRTDVSFWLINIGSLLLSLPSLMLQKINCKVIVAYCSIDGI